MKFEDSGLKRNKTVEDAFNYVSTYYQSFLVPEAMDKVRQQFEGLYQAQMDELDEEMKDIDAAKEAGKISADKYKEIKSGIDQDRSQIERMKSLQINRLPELVENELSRPLSLAQALEIQQYSEKSSPAVLAAALLLDCVSDPLEYQEVDAKFGHAIAGLVAEIKHIEAHPGSNMVASLATSSSDAKCILMAQMTSSLEQIAAQSAKLPPGARMVFPPKEEEKSFGKAKALWGNDKSLDMRLVDVFNRVAEVVSSSFRIEMNADAMPELVQSVKKTPSVKKKEPVLGDDNF